MTAHAHHEHAHHDGDSHAGHDLGGLTAMAASATLHCLTGCAIGEIIGLVVGTAAGLGALPTIALSIALAFAFGYVLSAMPLLRAGLELRRALGIVLVADTLSILTMEVVDNLVVAVVPGAMDAGLVNPTFWASLALALVAAYAAAYPVNRALLRRGRGHALTHGFHGSTSPSDGWRRWIPAFATSTLAASVGAFLLGGLVVSLADRLG